ncbi:hypothetical protein AVEN_233669-1 [Araneus ventricosus]|uniref:Ig-like domain-containing protein n=1 Tax=Araneus ventricosus TaxID=182803 RepID=A0A4Y2UVE9_ARAVE|nr:hypothetical protein AVEN_233669-1 [Araneus ventricosus]
MFHSVFLIAHGAKGVGVKYKLCKRAGVMIILVKMRVMMISSRLFFNQGAGDKMEDKTAVFIEDRTIVQDDKSGVSYEVDLECVPSGWFVWESIIWFKDGASIYTETSLQSLHLVLKAPFRMEIVSELQGYYYCSVALDNRSKHVFSPKMLVKFPGLHTFVLHMKSEVPGYGNCSDVISMELPFIEEFNKYLDVFYSDVSKLFLKDVNCSGSVISTYHHFYILKDKGTEKELQNFLKRSINSRNGTLFESLKRINISKDDIILKSTVSCPKEMSHYNECNLTWPETRIGQTTLADELCITVEGRALERKCLGDFNTGAYWSPVEKDCVDVQSELTVTLHKLAKRNITEDNILNTTLSMEMLTTTSEDISSTDVQYVAQILRNAASVPAVEPAVSYVSK